MSRYITKVPSGIFFDRRLPNVMYNLHMSFAQYSQSRNELDLEFFETIPYSADEIEKINKKSEKAKTDTRENVHALDDLQLSYKYWYMMNIHEPSVHDLLKKIHTIERCVVNCQYLDIRFCREIKKQMSFYPFEFVYCFLGKLFAGVIVCKIDEDNEPEFFSQDEQISLIRKKQVVSAMSDELIESLEKLLLRAYS